MKGESERAAIAGPVFGHGELLSSAAVEASDRVVPSQPFCYGDR